MPGKRNRRSKTQKFYCPHCQERLWRASGQRYHLVYTGMVEIKKRLNLSTTKARFVASSGSVTDNNCWIEEFYCGEHGQMWLLVKRQEDGSLTSVLAESPHWKHAAGVIDPDRPNASVSEYSLNNSRGTRILQ